MNDNDAHIQTAESCGVAEDMTPQRFTFGKAERLRHRTLVEGLFTAGRTEYAFPLRLTWRVMTAGEVEGAFRTGIPPRVGRLQMLVTVPKKKLRHAVDRVLMRRRIREAYRLNRLPLLHALKRHPGLYLQVAFIYLHNGETDYATVEKKMKRLLSRLETNIDSL